MNNVTITGNGPFDTSLRMSSVEIAELMKKRHDHVMRDIKELIDKKAISLPNFGESTYKNERGKEYPMYELDFESSMVLITGYDPKRRAIVIRRWMDLETGAATPLGVVGNMISVNRDYFASVLKNTNLLEENNALLKILLEEAKNKIPKRKNFTPEEDEKVMELRSQGQSHREIGLKLGRKPGSIRSCLRRLRKAGIYKEAGA